MKTKSILKIEFADDVGLSDLSNAVTKIEESINVGDYKHLTKKIMFEFEKVRENETI